MGESRWTGLGFLVLLLLLWEAAGQYGWIHKLFFPPATKILASFFQIVASGEVLGHVGVSLWRAGLGYGLAAPRPLTRGVLMGYWRVAYESLEVVVELLRAVPPPAIIPVAIVFLGIGGQMKGFIILFSSAL